ncbi:MAG: hypothetical protein Ct9H300mP12_15490 [Acidimicrobiales bacterium]|nr:MAG: hypothetical protein Ct9H300mP12_15490 [Acidimicrobiales bacterium]
MLVERFGEDIDYTPTGRGFTGMVWVLPVLAAAPAVAGLGLAITRWRSGAPPEVDDRGDRTAPHGESGRRRGGGCRAGRCRV